MKRQEDLKAMRQDAAEKRETKREEWREKLQSLKDERKQKMVENIDERIAKLNDKWVDHWNRTLKRLTAILDKISEKADGEADNKAIANATKAIEEAQKAVNSQAGKTYEITIADDTPIGQSVRSTISNFHNDLKVVKEAVKKAKDATVEALRTVVGANDEERSDKDEK